jgi:hypothetical protein
MNFFRCKLVHLNLNAISVLSCFTMLCECWLGVTPDTNMFCYFYSQARYDNTVFSGIRLSLEGVPGDHLQGLLKRCILKVVSY